MKKKDKSKGKNLIFKIIGVIFLCLVVGVISYYGTLYLDNLKKGNDVRVTVTFDDTETYIIPSILKMDKEKAMEEWPYMFEVLNEGSSKGLYQIILTDEEASTISRDKLDYVLILDDKEIKEGHLNKLKNNVLYEGEILGNKTQKYQLYIWVTDDVSQEDTYEYKLEFNTIKSGGPGF